MNSIRSLAKGMGISAGVGAAAGAATSAAGGGSFGDVFEGSLYGAAFGGAARGMSPLARKGAGSLSLFGKKMAIQGVGSATMAGSASKIRYGRSMWKGGRQAYKGFSRFGGNLSMGIAGGTTAGAMALLPSNNSGAKTLRSATLDNRLSYEKQKAKIRANEYIRAREALR